MNIKLGEHIVILCSFIHQLLSNRYKLITNVRSSLMAVNIHITIIERSEERFSRNAETDLVCRLLLEKKKKIKTRYTVQPQIHKVVQRKPSEATGTLIHRQRQQH